MKVCRICNVEKSDDEFGLTFRDWGIHFHYYCKPCHTLRSKEWNKKNRERYLENQKRRHKILQEKILEHYGRICQCCNATESLSVDHINGDGDNMIGAHIRWKQIIDDGFPDDIQILCLSCNNSKGEGTMCHIHGKEFPRVL